MDIKQILTIVINVLTVLADKTATTIDDKVLGLLKALQDSPLVLDWLASILKRQDGIPNSALPQVDSSDPQLSAAFNNSPAVREWALSSTAKTPHGAEAFSAGGVLVLLKYLPTLIALFKAVKDTGLIGGGTK